MRSCPTNLSVLKVYIQSEPLSAIPGECLGAKHGSRKKNTKLNQKIFLYAKRVKSLGGEGPKQREKPQGKEKKESLTPLLVTVTR